MRRKKRKLLRLIYFFSFIALLTFLLNYFIIKNKDYYLKSFKEVLGIQSAREIIRPYGKNTDLSDFEKKLTDKELEIEKIQSTSGGESILVYLRNGVIVIFARNKNLDWQIDSVKSIISRLTVESKKPKKIDFSFEKPIVSY